MTNYNYNTPIVVHSFDTLYPQATVVDLDPHNCSTPIVVDTLCLETPVVDLDIYEYKTHEIPDEEYRKLINESLKMAYKVTSSSQYSQVGLDFPHFPIYKKT